MLSGRSTVNGSSLTIADKPAKPTTLEGLIRPAGLLDRAYGSFARGRPGTNDGGPHPRPAPLQGSFGGRVFPLGPMPPHDPNLPGLAR